MAPSGVGSVYQNHFPEGACAHLCQPPETIANLGTTEIHHGSPASDTEYVTAYKPLPSSVEGFWNQSHADYLILGHTHIPMIERHSRGTVVNPGSVLGVTGIPTSYTFAVLDTAELSVRIFDIRTGREIRRDPSDSDKA
jgi:DNA repair exonuclease SbcCD nuclease subunit